MTEFHGNIQKATITKRYATVELTIPIKSEDDIETIRKWVEEFKPVKIRSEPIKTRTYSGAVIVTDFETEYTFDHKGDDKDVD